MSQSSALRDQPSMDEILASIRKIIDAGETQMKPEEKAVETVVTAPPPPANDAGTERPSAPQSILPQMPQTPPAPRMEKPVAAKETPVRNHRDTDIAAAVDAYLAAENPVRVPTPEAAEPAVAIAETGEAEKIAPAAESGSTSALEVEDEVEATVAGEEPEPEAVSDAEASVLADFSAIDRELLSDRQAKYDARFSETDDGVFKKVGSLLRETVEPSVPVAPPAAEKKTAGTLSTSLVSDAVSRSVSQSLANLSGAIRRDQGPDLDAMAEEMLRPMLQDWLDNNLPSLVERLVRAEIERIARGEPRVA